MSSRPLERRVAIVTGASRGIGRAVAVELAADGASVVVTSRSSEGVEQVVHTIRADGGEAIGVTCDIGVADDIRRMVATTVDHYGGVDILVNNAQSFGRRGAPTPSNEHRGVEEVSEEEWDWIFDTGVKATLRAMQAVFPHMRASGGGRIINFGSRRGVIGAEGTVAYNANKEAIRALSRTAAREWGQYGITVNVVNPAVLTEASLAHYAARPGYREAQLAQTPLGRIGDPREAARVVAFLAGPDAGYLTGMTFFVEGGLTILP